MTKGITMHQHSSYWENCRFVLCGALLSWAGKLVQARSELAFAPSLTSLSPKHSLPTSRPQPTCTRHSVGPRLGHEEMNPHDAKVSFLKSIEDGEEVESALAALLFAKNASTFIHEGDVASEYDRWLGQWVVCHAPHIVTLGKLLLTSFNVEYNFHPGGRMSSFSQYQSTLFGRGWLNADGRVAIQPGGKAVRVVFERFWWDIGQCEQPTVSPPKKDTVGNLVQTLGSLLFFEGISVFPVVYLDEDLCVFEFSATGTLVVAQRLGSSR
ncbi:unnamed protein product [Choristocarpus tenellus]